jgi:hypothetical protein
VVGYSMGSMVAARLVPEEPRTRALVLGGVGATVTPPRTGGRAPEAIAAALLADDPASIDSVAGKAFREFADFTGADRHALAALSRSDALRYSVRFDAITVPTLVVAGADDTLIRSPSDLADRFRPPGRDQAGDHLGAPYDPALASTGRISRGGTPRPQRPKAVLIVARWRSVATPAVGSRMGRRRSTSSSSSSRGSRHRTPAIQQGRVIKTARATPRTSSSSCLVPASAAY